MRRRLFGVGRNSIILQHMNSLSETIIQKRYGPMKTTWYRLEAFSMGNRMFGELSSMPSTEEMAPSVKIHHFTRLCTPNGLGSGLEKCVFDPFLRQLDSVTCTPLPSPPFEICHPFAVPSGDSFDFLPDNRWLFVLSLLVSRVSVDSFSPPLVHHGHQKELGPKRFITSRLGLCEF